MWKQKNKIFHRNKIFYLITSLDYGGTQRQLYYLIKNLNFYNDKYLPIVISLKTGGRFEKLIKTVCKYVYSLYLPEKVSLKSLSILFFCIFKFFFLLIRYRPKIIHSFLFQANIFAKLAKIFFWNTKVICSERVAEKQKLWQHTISKLTNFLADRIVVNSEEVKEFIINYQKITPKKVVVIPNMIDVKEIKFCYKPEELRKMLNINLDTFVICTAGRLHKQKGYDLLLEIVKELVNECENENLEKDFVVIILGDGEEYYNLLHKAKKLKIGCFVKFLGYQENIYDYINMSDLFVLTSYWEGSPNIVLEAITIGKPVISTSVEGIKHLLQDSFIVSLQQDREKIVKEFVKKIMYIYKEYKNQNKVLFKKQDVKTFAPDVVIEKILALYY